MKLLVISLNNTFRNEISRSNYSTIYLFCLECEKMKQVLKLLNSLVVLTISSMTVIACGNENVINIDKEAKYRNGICSTRRTKKDC